MEEFISYFWNNQGYIYDPAEEIFFGRYHIEMMLLMALIFVILWFIGKAIKNKKGYIRFISITCLLLEGLRILYFRTSLNFTWFNSITLHMCSVVILYVVIAGLFKSQLFYDFVFIQALTAGITPIIIPYGILPGWNEFSFIPLQSNISHMLIVFFALYGAKHQLFHVKMKRYYLGVASVILTASAIHIFNLYKYSIDPGSNSNFFWTRYPDPLFPLINDYVFPYHFLILVGLILIIGFISYFIGEKLTIHPKN